MLITDDQRRWVTGNEAAAELLGIARDEIPWRTMDHFTPPDERLRLHDRWSSFLASGEAEGEYQLYFQDRGVLPVEFSATANVLPSRHLAVFVVPDESSTTDPAVPLITARAWESIAARDEARPPLTTREREVMTLVASGQQSSDVAKRLYLSTETVRSHVQNAMVKLGAHTRAHAVAITLVTGQITWDV